ncbi:hypothetical protein ACGF5M_02995 [Gemmatimonadota bacterium]
MSKPEKHGPRIRWMVGTKVMERALNPDAIEAVLFSQREDTEGRGKRKGHAKRIRHKKRHLLDERGWEEFWKHAEEAGFTDGEAVQVGSNPMRPPEICIKLRDCTLWCEPD